MNPSYLAAVAALGCALLATAGAQEPAQTGANAARVSFTVRDTLTSGAGTEEVRLAVLIPRTLPGRQRILKIDYSVEPSRTFEEGGNSYAEFVFKKPARTTEVAVTVDAEVYRYDLATAAADGSNRLLEENKNLKRWLSREDYLEKDAPEIVEAAKELLGKDDVETVRKTMDFVTRTLRRGPYDPQDHGALWALHKKQGDCTEFADLFVALCRANNLPARFRQGFLVCDIPKGSTPKHDWAEVYLADYGWVPFDPSRVRDGGATVDVMQTGYLYLDALRRNSVLHGYHFCYVRYRGTECKLGEEFRLNSRKELGPK
jgi:hypothetical protein